MDTSSFFDYPTLPQRQPESVSPSLLPDRSEAEWETLLAYMQTRRFRPGDTVVAAGEHDRALYVLTDGTLEVLADPPRLPIAGPAIVGEAAFFDGRPRAASLLALTDGEVLRLGYDAFEGLAAREPLLARDFLLDLGRILSTRLRAAGEHAEWSG
jgi:CRP/FNR family cyclic AMP-dependent transcriptional regulator